MANKITLNEVLLSVLYVFMLIIVLILINLGFAWLFNNVLVNLFNWFNDLSFFWKIVLIIIGAVGVIGLIMNLLAMLAVLVNAFVLRHFPDNLFTRAVAIILILINIVTSLIQLWKIPESFDFWIVCELLIVSYCIWVINTVVMHKSSKE